jgi:hypothetical protein
MQCDCYDLSKDTTEACYGAEENNVKYSSDMRLRLEFELQTCRSLSSDIVSCG